MHKKRLTLTHKQQITIGVWLIVIGIAFLTSNYFLTKKLKAYESINFELSEIPRIEEAPPGDEIPDNDLNDMEKDENGNDVFIDQPYFIGRLEIPDINLVKGFASKNSKQNNVNRNIQVMKASDYPNVDKGNFIISGHNGTGAISYFRNLHKLKKGSNAIVYYKDYKYTYKLINIYDVKKTGTVKIYRNLNKTTLTLITCKTGDIKGKQTVYIYELTKKERV